MAGPLSGELIRNASIPLHRSQTSHRGRCNGRCDKLHCYHFQRGELNAMRYSDALLTRILSFYVLSNLLSLVPLLSVATDQVLWLESTVLVQVLENCGKCRYGPF